MSEDARLKKLLSKQQFGPSSSQEIYEDASGKRWEKLTQRIDLLSGKLEDKVRGALKNIQEVVTVREYQEPLTTTTSAQVRNQFLKDMPEAERQAIIAEKFRKKREKKERRDEQMRIAQLDEEELMEEAKKSTSQRKMEAEIAERSLLALQNVDTQRELKTKLKSEGKNKIEIKKALKELKKSQRSALGTDEEEPKDKKYKNRGRPKKTALKNPRKDPETGKMVEASALK